MNENKTTVTEVTEVRALSAKEIQAIKDVPGLRLKLCDTGLFLVLAAMTPEAEAAALALYHDQAIKAADAFNDTAALILTEPMSLKLFKAYKQAANKAERAYCYLWSLKEAYDMQAKDDKEQKEWERFRSISNRLER